MAFFDFTGSNGDPLPAGLTARDGTFNIQNNKCVALTVSGAALAGDDASLSDGFVEATVNGEGLGANNHGIYFRRTDNDNYWQAVINTSSGLVTLFERTAAVTTDRGTFTVTPYTNTTDTILKAIFTGTSIDIEVDGTSRITTTSSVHQSATDHGLRLGNTTASIDNLTIPPAAVDSITITNDDFELRQRDGSDNATHTFNMTWTGTPTTIEYSVDGGGFITGDATPTGNASVIPVVLTVGEHTLIFRFSNDTGVNDTVINIATGDFFIYLGQSNSSGRGDNNQVFTSNVGGATAHLFGNDDNHKVMTDPSDSATNFVDAISNDGGAAVGSHAPRFCHHWLAANNIPVGIIPCNLSGTPIAEFEKLSSVRVSGLNQYESMDRRVAAVGGIAGVIFDQGERDANNVMGTLGTTYVAALDLMIDDIFADFGVPTIIRALQTLPSSYDGNGTTTGQIPIRDAQLSVVASNANAYITVPMTDIDLTDGDGVHFAKDDELDTVGLRIYNATKLPLGFASTLNLTVTGIPDGTFMTVLDEADGTRLQRQNETYSSETVSIVVDVAVGETVKGYVDDNSNPSSNAAYIEGITV